MAHRRSGAKRRSAQKAAIAAQEQQQNTSQETNETGTGAATAQAGQPGENCPGSSDSVVRSSKLHRLLPEVQEVVAAVASLYIDELKPFGRILRKRVAERHAASTGSQTLRDVDVAHLRKTCDECSQLDVELEEGGDWSVTLCGCPSTFVNVYGSDDTYAPELWASAQAYFDNCGEEDMTLPGGRYSCAQALLSRGLPFLQGRSLGQICHIVQLAISKKKILGYLNGAVVPYSRSQSMMKEKCAVKQQAVENLCEEAASLPMATWETARSSLRKILEDAAISEDHSGCGVIPLSNVKRVFRSQFQLELCETVLGHAKLSDLLQDPRFADICSVHLEGHGYTVVQVRMPIINGASSFLENFVPYDVFSDVQETSKSIFCPDEPLCLDDVGDSIDALTFGPTPGPFGPTPAASPGALLGHCDQDFPGRSSDKPDCLGSVVQIGMPAVIEASGLFGPTPLPSPQPLTAGDPCTVPRPSSVLPCCASTQSEQDGIKSLSGVLHQDTKDSAMYAKDPLRLEISCPALGGDGIKIQNTFIHSASPPPTPAPCTLRRSVSLPQGAANGQTYCSPRIIADSSGCVKDSNTSGVTIDGVTENTPAHSHTNGSDGSATPDLKQTLHCTQKCQQQDLEIVHDLTSKVVDPSEASFPSETLLDGVPSFFHDVDFLHYYAMAHLGGTLNTEQAAMFTSIVDAGLFPGFTLSQYTDSTFAQWPHASLDPPTHVFAEQPRHVLSLAEHLFTPS